MRTLSVKEVAGALGLTKRAIMYRLESGKLKGTRVTNSYGQEEWRIYPNKEIMQAMAESTKGQALTQGSFNFSEELEKSDESEEYQSDRTTRMETAVKDPQFETLAARVQDLEALLRKNSVEESPSAALSESQTTGQKVEDDVVDAVVSEDDSPVVETQQQQQQQQRNDQTTSDDTRSGANAVADALWNNLICRYQEKLEEKDQLIGRMTSELAEKDRQLKLLPDLQKQAEEERRQAEEERKSAELKELEAEALRKQVAAMQAKQTEADIAKQKIEELERTLTDSQRKAEEEIERLKQEKEAQVTAVQEQLQVLSVTVQELQKPKPSWFQKWFLPSQDDK